MAKIPQSQSSEPKGMIVRLGLIAAIVALATASTPAMANQRASAPIVSAGIQQAAAGPSGSWTTYHHDNAHTGYDPAAPTMSAVLPTPGWTESALDGEVYAEALVYNGLVYAATLNNTVYALNQATGLIVWSNHLGTPQASGWICGNVAPMGILGTPVIDTVGNRIYAVAEIAGATPTYRLFGLDLGTGTILLNAVIAPLGFDWKIQQERGALALANGYVYVPFGGRAGDCFDGGTPYYGWIVGVPTNGGTNIQYRTPSGAESVWAPGGVVVDDTSHNVFFPTGNAIPCPGSTFSDAIVRTSPTLTSPTFFEPLDWQANWCGPDSDLGSASPTLISPTLMFMAGKRGGGFLLNPTNLGGVGGQLYPPPLPAAYAQAEVCFGNHGAATYGSFAYAAPFIYLECEGRGLVALNVNTSTPSFSPCDTTCASPDWHAGAGITFGPPIVAGGAVWVASNSGLYAFNATTGAQIYHSASFGVNRFVTPTEAGSQVLVPSHTVVKSFSFGVTVTPAKVAFGGQAPGTTSAAQTVTLYNIQAVTLNVTTAALTGANAANYVKGTDTCTAAAVPANGTCTVQVSLMPGGFGGFPATLTFIDSGAGSPRTVALNGMGALNNSAHLYTLDGWGGLHPDAGAPSLATSAYWPYWNIARSVAIFPDGLGGYVLDGWGGLHAIGNAPSVSNYAYWPYWDIARQVVLAPWSSASNVAGWTLDGWGGVHAFGSAPAISNYTWWPNWDIARGIAILPDSTPTSVGGYTLDGWGGIHPFGVAPAIANYSYWPYWDIARGLTFSSNASVTNPAGWTVDGWGGVHPFGTAPAVAMSAYWPYFDIARGVVSWTGPGSGAGGWVLDGWGGIHSFGNAPTISAYAYWPYWDIATSLAGPGANSGSRRGS